MRRQPPQIVMDLSLLCTNHCIHRPKRTSESIPLLPPSAPNGPYRDKGNARNDSAVQAESATFVANLRDAAPPFVFCFAKHLRHLDRGSNCMRDSKKP